MVESIEKLCAELDIASFSQQMQRRALDDRNVRVILAWPKHNANTAVAESGGACVVANNRPDRGTRGIPQNARLVEIVGQLTLNRASIHQIVLRDNRSKQRPLAGNYE